MALLSHLKMNTLSSSTLATYCQNKLSQLCLRSYNGEWRVMLKLKTIHQLVCGTLTTGAHSLEICDHGRVKNKNLPQTHVLIL
jgi:hypothetical protein